MNENDKKNQNQNPPQQEEPKPSNPNPDTPKPDNPQADKQQNMQNSPDIMQVVSTLTAQVSALTEQVAALKSSFNPLEQNIVVNEGNPIKEGISYEEVNEGKDEPGIDFDFTNFEDMDLLNIPKSHK